MTPFEEKALVDKLAGEMLERRRARLEEESFAHHTYAAARWILYQALEAWLEEGWERMPEIGLHDFERIAERAERLLPPDVTLDEYREALAFFEARAEAGRPRDEPLPLGDI